MHIKTRAVHYITARSDILKNNINKQKDINFILRKINQLLTGGIKAPVPPPLICGIDIFLS
jgi:hypothetical protein